MTVTNVLLASDSNPRYVEFWPLARRAWREIGGLEARLVLVAHDQDVPTALRADPQVTVFAPIEDLHTAFQAQCIRLLYPALLHTRGAVLISDMELMPLSRRYWHEPVGPVDASFFVAYRDVEHGRQMVAIPYNAAEPSTWSDVFGIRTLDDVRERLVKWSASVEYDGVRGGAGWYTDQRALHDALEQWDERSRRVWFLDDDYTGFRRLDRDETEGGLSARQRLGILAGRYTDFNAPVPHSEHRELNEHVVDLALAAHRRRLPRRRRPVLRPQLQDPAEAEALSAWSGDPSFITGNGLASRCRYVLNYDDLRLDDGLDNNWWFCKTDFIDYFFEELAPQEEFVLFSHNSDYAIDARFAERLEHDGLVAWFAANAGFRHPKLHAFPLGIANPYWPHGDVAALRQALAREPRKSKLLDASYDPRTNPAERRRCSEGTGIPSEPRKPYAEYLSELRESHFCLSPRGNGIDTHRTWEALYLGTVPVVTRSLLTEQHPDLPMIVLEDWSEFKAIDFSPDLYERVWGDWDPDAISLDRYLDGIRGRLDSACRRSG